MERSKSLFQRNKKVLWISLCTLFAIVLLTGLTYRAFSGNTDFSNQPGYEEMLQKAISEKNYEMEQKVISDRETYPDFLVTEEMLQNPKYQNEDGSFNSEIARKDLGIPTKSTPEGALGEVYMSAIDGSVNPHVLGATEVGIYSNETNEPWSFQGGDKIKLHAYVDTEEYGYVGSLNFGVFKADEPILVKNLNPEYEATVETEYEFEYTIEETGEYFLYLFRSSMEPIVIKWIDISF